VTQIYSLPFFYTLLFVLFVFFFPGKNLHMVSSAFLLFGKIQHGVARTKNYLVGEVSRDADIEDDNHSSVLATIMNPSVDDRLKGEERIEKILNKAVALTALVRERSLEKFAAQLQREELVER